MRKMVEQMINSSKIHVAVKPLAFINEWVGSLSGKSSSVENKIIVIRQFLEFLKHTGESVAMPSIPSLR